MTDVKLNIPWHRYALIVYLAEKMQEKGQRFGKTALQKLIYLLQTIYQIPVGYHFSLYMYGPFCSDLMDDLDYVSCIGGVAVSMEEGSVGYTISLSSNAELIKDKGRDFLTDYQPQIDELLETFGAMRVRDLELRSTIIFVDRDAVAGSREIGRDDFVQEIKSIKPHFSYDEINQAVDELESLGYIERR